MSKNKTIQKTIYISLSAVILSGMLILGGCGSAPANSANNAPGQNQQGRQWNGSPRPSDAPRPSGAGQRFNMNIPKPSNPPANWDQMTGKEKRQWYMTNDPQAWQKIQDGFKKQATDSSGLTTPSPAASGSAQQNPPAAAPQQ